MSEQPVVVERLAERRLALHREQERAADAQQVGQLPTPVNLTLYQGDDFFLNVTVVGESVDLTTYTPKADICATPGGAVVASFEATIDSPTVIRLHLASAQTALLTANGVWDLQITDPVGLVTTVCAGTVTIVRQVTT